MFGFIITVVIIATIGFFGYCAYNSIAHGQEIRQAQLVVPQKLKIVQDCVRIVNTTKEPGVFFERYDTMITTLRELSQMEHYVRLTGTLPSEHLQEYLSKKEYTMNAFIDRYFFATQNNIMNLSTKKARLNNAKKFNDIMNFYKPRMPKRTAEYADKKHQELVDICNTL